MISKILDTIYAIFLAILTITIFGGITGLFGGL